MTANTISKHEDNKWLKLIFLAIFCFIAFLAIIIRTGWKYLHKAIPKIAPSKKWPNWPIAAGQLTAFIVLSIFINLWYQPEQIDDGSNFYRNKMHDLSRALDGITFQSFDNVRARLPAEIKEIYNRTQVMATFDMTGLKNLEAWLTPGNCSSSDVNTVTKASLDIKSVLDILSSHKSTLEGIREGYIIWKGNITNDVDSFMKERELFRNHSLAVRKYLKENVTSNLAEWEEKIKIRTTDSTGFGSYHVKYIVPGAIVFLFSIFSIYCTLYHTHVQIIRVGRTVLHALFYIISIQAILVSIDELYLNSLQDCQSKIVGSVVFDLFQSPSYHSSSTLNSRCVTHIFSAPNDNVFVPEPEYFHDLRDSLTSLHTVWFTNIKAADEKFQQDIKIYDTVMADMSTLAGTCSDVNAYSTLTNNTKESLKNYLKLKSVSGDMAKKVAYKNLHNLKKAVYLPAGIFNSTIKLMNFDCRAIFDLYRHANDESCVSINSIVISHLELVIIGCSALLAVMHLLYLRRSDNTQYWNDPRVRWAHKFVTNVIEDEQLSEWKSTNCNHLQEATYKNFKANKLQNRYRDIKCIDESRVVLKNHTTDYIHASWVPIPGTRRRYIATQAPLPNTFADFWHMILQEKVEIVLQLCGYIENDIRICDVYFPAKRGAKKVYGHVEVTCIEEKFAPESTGLWQTVWRSLQLIDRNAPNPEAHIINHVFFQNWFDEMVPRDNSRIPNLYRWINSLNDNERDSPICVLCDTGVGRTGIYITFDYANSLIEQDRFISMAEVNNQVANFRWGVIDAYLDFLFIFMSLVTYYIQEGLLYFEDWSVPFKKYEDFLMNRMARMDRSRTKKEVDIQYWKSERDPEKD